MTESISSLTEEQSRLIGVYRDKWFNAGICTEPANRESAEEGIRFSYERAGHAPPDRIIWADSPREIAIMITMIKSEKCNEMAIEIIKEKFPEAEIWEDYIKISNEKFELWDLLTQACKNFLKKTK